MPYSPTEPESRVLAVLDLGSNSVRLMIVRADSDGKIRVLNQTRHMIRLGEGVFVSGLLSEKAMNRALPVLRSLAEECAACGVDEVEARATAAVRDARNGSAFLARVKEETGLAFSVLSGREEARLIYLGVSSRLEQSDLPRLFIDIGGGSTELAVGDSTDWRDLESLSLGSVRLAGRFCEGDSGPVSPARYREICRYIRAEADQVLRRMGQYEPVEGVASSGTAHSVADVASALTAGEAADDTGEKKRCSILTREGLSLAVQTMCGLSLEERRLLPGLNPSRADVIVPGAAILQVIMETMGLECLRISRRGLRHGILENWMIRQGWRR